MDEEATSPTFSYLLGQLVLDFLKSFGIGGQTVDQRGETVDFSFDEEASDVEKFGINLAINFGVCLVAFCIFLTLKTYVCSPNWFNFRRYWNNREFGIERIHDRNPYELFPEYKQTNLKLLGDPGCPWGWVSWLWPTIYGYKEEDLFETHGTDLVIYIRFAKICLLMCLLVCGPALIIILPINVSGGNKDLPEDDSSYVEGLGVTTLGNIEQRDPRMTTHTVMSYLFSFIFYGCMIAAYRSFLSIRKRYLNINCPRAYTIMVTEIPPDMRSDENLRDFFEVNFPGHVVDAHIAWDTKKIRAYIDKRRTYINQYERLVEGSECCQCCRCGSRKNKKKKKPWCNCFCCAHRKNSDKDEDFFITKIRSIEDKIYDAQEDRSKKCTTTAVGFVTFDSMFPARIKVYPGFQKPIKLTCPDLFLLPMEVTPAPEMNDIVWENLPVSKVSFIIRSVLVALLMFVLVAFWTFPTVLISTVTNLNELSDVDGFGWLKFIRDFPSWLQGFLQGFIAAAALYLLLQLVYPVVKFIQVRIQGSQVHSAAARRILLTYWVFLIVNILFVTTLGGSILTILDDIIEEPGDVVKLLASHLPQQSLFFMQYILVAGLGRIPFNLFRAGNIFFLYFGLTFATNRRQTLDAGIPRSIDYARIAAQDLLVFTICIVYSVMAPLVTVFGVMYFSLVILVFRYNLIYNVVPDWEGGGLMWTSFFHMIMAGILIFQLTMLGVLSVGEFGPVGALIVLPILTVILWVLITFYWHDGAFYGPIFGLDKIEPTLLPIALKDQYLQPSLSRNRIKPYNAGDFTHGSHHSKQKAGFTIGRQRNLEDEYALTDDSSSDYYYDSSVELELLEMGNNNQDKQKGKQKEDVEIMEDKPTVLKRRNTLGSSLIKIPAAIRAHTSNLVNSPLALARKRSATAITKSPAGSPKNQHYTQLNDSEIISLNEKDQETKEDTKSDSESSEYYYDDPNLSILMGVSEESPSDDSSSEHV